MDIVSKVFLINVILWISNYIILRQALNDIEKDNNEVTKNNRFIKIRKLSDYHQALSFASILVYLVYVIGWLL